MKDILAKNREYIITGLLVLFSLSFLTFFRESSNLSPVFQGLVIAVIFFLVIPTLYCRIILKRSLKSLGFQQGNTKAGIISALISVGIALCIVFGLSRIFPEFQTTYTLPFFVERNFIWFLLYEILLIPAVAFLYEVFFRGFVQLLWLRSLGWRAIPFQAALFVLPFLISGDLSWSDVPLLLFAPFAGFVAYRSRSIWYSFLASAFFFLLIDILFLILR